MAGLQSAFSDVEEVRKSEINKPIPRRKGATVLAMPERNDSKIKHKYTGIAQIKDDTIVKVYPDLESIKEFNQKKIHNICSKKRKDVLEGGFQWSYVKNL